MGRFCTGSCRRGTRYAVDRRQLEPAAVRYSTRRYIRTRLRRLTVNPFTGTSPAADTIRVPWSQEATNVLPPWYCSGPSSRPSSATMRRSWRAYMRTRPYTPAYVPTQRVRIVAEVGRSKTSASGGSHGGVASDTIWRNRWLDATG